MCAISCLGGARCTIHCPSISSDRSMMKPAFEKRSMSLFIGDQYLDPPGEQDIKRIGFLSRAQNEGAARIGTQLNEGGQQPQLIIGKR